MTKEILVETLKKILRADCDLGFLVKLNKDELETLVARVRDRVEHME